MCSIISRNSFSENYQSDFLQLVKDGGFEEFFYSKNLLNINNLHLNKTKTITNHFFFQEMTSIVYSSYKKKKRRTFCKKNYVSSNKYF